MNSKLSFKDQVKLENERMNYRKKCPCGHSVIVLPTAKSGKDYVICNWCHGKVFKDDEKQETYNKKVKRENFRLRMWKLI